MNTGTKRHGRRTREGGLDIRLTRRLGAYVLGHKALVGVSLAAMLLTDLLQVLTPALVKLGIDRDVAARDLRGLRTTALLLAAAMVGRFATQVGFTVIVEMLGQRLLFDLRLDLLRKVLRLGNDYFDRTPVGATLTNVTNDVEAVRQFISDGIVNILGDSVKVLFILGAMVLINPGLAAVTFISLPLFAIATVAFRNALRHGFRGVRAANAAINTSLSETVTGIREITVLNYQARSLSRIRGAQSRLPELLSGGSTGVLALFPHHRGGLPLRDAHGDGGGSLHDRRLRAGGRRVRLRQPTSPCCSCRCVSSPRSSTVSSRRWPPPSASSPCSIAASRSLPPARPCRCRRAVSRAPE